MAPAHTVTLRLLMRVGKTKDGLIILMVISIDVPSLNRVLEICSEDCVFSNITGEFRHFRLFHFEATRFSFHHTIAPTPVSAVTYYINYCFV